VLQKLRRASPIVVAVAMLAVVGCSREDERFQQHREKFESLGSFTAAVAEAWLAGNTAGTYTRTALEQTFLLVEQERSTLASTPEALRDPRGAEMSKAAERLSRLIAAMIHDVRAADAVSLRQHLATIPIKPSETR
jgi:hypothetical protein